MGRLLKQKDMSGNQLEQKTETTAEGKLVTVKDGLNSSKRYYDSQQKLIRVENSDGSTSKYSYNDAGQVARIEEGLPTGGKATMEVSPDRKTVMIQDPRGVRTEYRFNDHNLLTETSVNNRRAASYRYDDSDRLSAVSYENGSSETLSYDGEGRVIAYRRDDSGNGARATEMVSFSYDQQGEMTGIGNSTMGQVLIAKEPGVVTVTRGNAVLRYQYDGDRLAKVEGPAGSAVTYTYQQDGRLRGLELSRNGRTRRLEFTDNSVLARTSSGGDTSYLYAPTGLLGSVQNSYGGRTLYSYDNKNRLQRIELPNGRCLEYLYDPVTDGLREERATVCRK
jgi:YD repeat-containing protein